MGKTDCIFQKKSTVSHQPPNQKSVLMEVAHIGSSYGHVTIQISSSSKNYSLPLGSCLCTPQIILLPQLQLLPTHFCLTLHRVFLSFTNSSRSSSLSYLNLSSHKSLLPASCWRAPWAYPTDSNISQGQNFPCLQFLPEGSMMYTQNTDDGSGQICHLMNLCPCTSQLASI